MMIPSSVKVDLLQLPGGGGEFKLLWVYHVHAEEFPGGSCYLKRTELKLVETEGLVKRPGYRPYDL
jgi:hypothetical protein